jgi:hypothetical protein
MPTFDTTIGGDNMLVVLFCVFVLFLCIGIMIYVIRDVMKDLRKMSSEFKEKERKQRKRRW